MWVAVQKSSRDRSKGVCVLRFPGRCYRASGTLKAGCRQAGRLTGEHGHPTRPRPRQYVHDLRTPRGRDALQRSAVQPPKLALASKQPGYKYVHVL